MTASTAPQRLRELDGMLRKGGVTITPAPSQQVGEEVSLSVGDSGGEEKFVVTLASQNTAAGQGTVTLYNTRTGEHRPGVTLNIIEREMKRVHTGSDFPEWTGRPLYTLDKSSAPEWVRPMLPCYLNPACSEWETYRKLSGGHVCKTPLMNEMEQEEHLRVKHPATYQRREREHQRELEEEEREWRRWQMTHGSLSIQEAAAGQFREEPLPIVISQRKPNPSGPVAGECDTCHEQFTAKSKLGLNSKMRAHMRTHE